MEKEKIIKEKTLIILRGISGSGKSTLSQNIIKNNGGIGVVFSTDEFFMKNDKYVFQPENLGRAHQWNEKRTGDAMKSGSSLIIVDNTNTQKWEAKPYVELGVHYGYTIKFDEPTTSWAKDASELAKRNAHGVPLDAIKRMLGRWETDFTVENILKSNPPQRHKK
jgi:predicted kinase